MLVNYSDSSSESDDNRPAIKPGHRKRKAEPAFSETIVKKQPPPLPSSFHSLYATAARSSTSDDPSLHSGRTRQVPHVVGNWSAHVYLEWYPSPTELTVLDDVIWRVQQYYSSEVPGSPHPSIRSFLRSDLGTLLPLHISLSTPLILKTEQRGPFQESIETQLACAQIVSFSLDIVGLNWVSNYDKTRVFLVLTLSRPRHDELNRLLSICNSSAHRFGLSRLYDGMPSDAVEQQPPFQSQDICDHSDAFHISIAWALQEPRKDASAGVNQTALDPTQPLKVDFDMLKVRIGNTVNDIPLTKHDHIDTPSAQ